MHILSVLLYLTSIIYLDVDVEDAQVLFRILGPNSATPEEFPYVVSIRVNRQHICGGAIIDYLWVLTAAHCVTIKNLNEVGQILIMAGTIDLSGTGGTLHAVSEIFIHKNFTHLNVLPSQGDVALLKLTNRFEYSNSIQPIALADIGTEQDVIMVGWGATSSTQLEMSQALKFVKMVTKESDAFCTSDEYHVCAVAASGEGTCVGDSGGPLVDSYSRKLVGINSAGSKSCGVGIADTFTRVYPYWNWISYIKFYK